MAKFDLHLRGYMKCFPLAGLNFDHETILDIGSGAISVLEKLATENSNVTPYDLLAEEYNRIAPDKKFQIQDHVPEEARFSLITLFNMIDHVVEPADVLDFAVKHLDKSGRLWLAVHLYQPHGKKGHPQNFSCRSVVDLISTRFRIERCGVIRESVPNPYLWYGELKTSTKPQSHWTLGWFKFKTGAHCFQFQLTRGLVKIIKIVGMRSLLPVAWQF